MKRLTPLFGLFLTLGLQIAFSQEAKKAADFYDNSKIQDIKIVFPQSNWSYILDSLRFNGNGMLEGTVTINGQIFEKAGIRYRGSKSFSPNNPRNPFHIALNYKNKEQNLQGYTTIKLSNALRDPSMVREVLGYEIARSYMPAPKANYAKVTINGKYYGLLVNVESAEDPQFLQRYFGSAGNAFFKVNQEPKEPAPAGCKSNLYGALEYDESPACYENNFEKLSDHGTKELIELTRILNEEPGKIETVLNVDNTLWMLAFNNITVNLSSYIGQHSINFYLYQDDKGRFTPIVWDLNLAFGSFKNIGSGSDLKFKALTELDPLLHVENPAKPLISRLLQNEEYKKTYLSHLRRILYDYFTNGKYDERAKALQQLIKKDVESDPGKSYTTEEFNQSLSQTIGKKSKIPGIVELMTKRTTFLKAHPDLSVFPPDIMDVAVANRKPLSNKKVENFQITAKVDKFPKRVTLMYKLEGSNEWRRATMLDDGKNDDGVAENGIFGTTIVPQNGEQSIQYYIMAENAGLLSYSPSNYMWEQHNATLENLNK
ncbi:MAG: CotH kinase family protein [Lewinellaceae bacterium]|nr:CotH kinase family protein [Saprospiraceae bacterium]MCB9339527.1 CotH kinase family protein [Lewinellaceae bacterium]